MKPSPSARRRGPALMVLVVSAILAGCGTGSAPTVAPPTGADPGGAPATTGPIVVDDPSGAPATTGPIVVDGDPSGAPATTGPIATPGPVSGGVEVTPYDAYDYKYRISVGPPIRKSTINPVGKPSGPTVAAVGSSYLTLAVTIENLSTDSAEPLSDVVNTFGDVENGELLPGVLFLATPASFNQQLNLPCVTDAFVDQLQGVCRLFTGVEKDPSISPDSLDPHSTQIPIGGSVTVTLVAGTWNNGPWQGFPDKLLSGADLILDSSNILLFYNGVGGTTQVPIGPG